MITVAYMSGPFVTYIHLKLPAFARSTQDLIMRYSKNLPKDAEIDITTMNVIGKPRVTRIKISELRPVKERYGLGNYARNTENVDAKRPWWMGKAVRLFGVHGGRSEIMGGEVWKNIEGNIQKNNKI